MRLLRVLPVLLFALSAQGSDSLRVVSDLDDTIKITNVDETGQAVWNGLFTIRAFAGMSDLYRSMKASNPNLKFTYLSASNEALRGKINRFLLAHQFPEGQVVLKGLLNFGSTHAYKVSKLEALLKKYPNEKFILIGDDTEHDPGVYEEISRKYPERVVRVYIRRVKGSPLPAGFDAFVTAFDVARQEYEAARLESDLVGRVALAILNEKRDSRVLPPFQACPAADHSSVRNAIEEWDALIDARIEKICAARD